MRELTPVDDLNVGDTVAVVGHKAAHKRCGDFSGHPWVVMAISLPFIALHDGNEVQSLDVRAWDVKKISKDYAHAMSGSLETVSIPPAIAEDVCPNCGDRYCERLVEVGKRKRRQWNWYCRTCHHDGGSAAKAPNT